MKIFTFNNMMEEMIFLFNNNYDISLHSFDIQNLIYDILRRKYGHYEEVFESIRNTNYFINICNKFESIGCLEYTLNNILKQVSNIFENRSYEVLSVRFKTNQMYIYISD